MPHDRSFSQRKEDRRSAAKNPVVKPTYAGPQSGYSTDEAGECQAVAGEIGPFAEAHSTPKIAGELRLAEVPAEERANQQARR